MHPESGLRQDQVEQNGVTVLTGTPTSTVAIIGQEKTEFLTCTVNEH